MSEKKKFCVKGEGEYDENGEAVVTEVKYVPCDDSGSADGSKKIDSSSQQKEKSNSSDAIKVNPEKKVDTKQLSQEDLTKIINSIVELFNPCVLSSNLRRPTKTPI